MNYAAIYFDRLEAYDCAFRNYDTRHNLFRQPSLYNKVYSFNNLLLKCSWIFINCSYFSNLRLTKNHLDLSSFEFILEPKRLIFLHINFNFITCNILYVLLTHYLHKGFRKHSSSGWIVTDITFHP